MTNAIHQNKKMIACLVTAKKIIFLFALLFAVGLNTSYAQNTWTKKATFGGTARRDVAGFSIGSKGYIGTGYDGKIRDDFWEYDPATNAWTQKANFDGERRSGAVGFSIGSKGYIGTGLSSGLEDFWEYDPVSNAWTQKANFGGGARNFAVGFSIGSKGYIGTGVDHGAPARDFWEYDPGTDTWTQKADFGGEARWGAVGFSIGNKGYIGTGRDSDQTVYYRDFYEYDPGTNTWTQKANFGGEARWSAVGFSIGSKGYVGTGMDHGASARDFWEYDSEANSWTQKANFGGIARFHAVGFSIGNKGYLGTGQPAVLEDNQRDFWEYTPDNACPPPDGLKARNASDTRIVLKWDTTGSDVVRLQLRYRVLGEKAWTKQKKNPERNQMHIDGLMPATTYQWQLRSVCAEDTSGWVEGPDFTTAASLNPGTKATAYPNPAKNTVTINYSVTKNGKYIFEMTNASGTVVLRKEANVIPGANRITLDINRFFKGVYFINIIRPDMTRERIQLSKE